MRRACRTGDWRLLDPMKRSKAARRCLHAALWLALCACAGPAAPRGVAAAAPGDAPRVPAAATPRFEALHAALRGATARGGYLGAVVLVARDGALLDVAAVGHRDLARREPVAPDAIFRVYSMTKTVAAVAAMQQVERGALSLDAPVSSVLPAFATQRVLDAETGALRAPARAMTLRHLLTHTAGLAAGLPGDAAAEALLQAAQAERSADLADFARRVARTPLAADPGTRFGYDGVGTELVARMVEAASGQRFDEYVRTRILAPLRMHDTGFDVPQAQRYRIVDLTRMGDDGQLALDDSASARTPGVRLRAYPSAAGGLYSTAVDWWRLCEMLRAGGTLDGARLLSPASVAAMLRNQLTMLDPPVHQFSDAEGFGFGGYVVLDPARRSGGGGRGAYGWSGAASTSFQIDPESGVVVIVLMQHLPRGDLPAGVADLPRLGPRLRALAMQAALP